MTFEITPTALTSGSSRHSVGMLNSFFGTNDTSEAIESFSHSGFEKAAFLKEEYGKIDVCMMDYFV